MKLGFFGAQGVGKTTLAEEVSNETGLPLVFTKTVDVFKRNGIRPDQVLPFTTRIAIQNEILDVAEALWSDYDSLVTDRTPIDMLAYTMIDINSGTRMTESECIAFMDYKNRCIQAINRNFAMLTLVQPGIPLDKGNKLRAALDPVLMDVMNTTMLGLISLPNIECTVSVLRRDCLDLKKRAKSVSLALSSLAVRSLTERGDVTLH